MENQAVTPDSLINILRIEAPSGVVLIKGVARSIQPWRRGGVSYVYGRLTLGRASISFRALPELAPNEDEPVIMQGTLHVEPASTNGEDWRATHRITLRGEVVGTWTPREPAEPPASLPRRDERLTLESFIAEHGVGALTVLVTGTARADITRSLSAAGISERPEFVEANFADADQFMETADRARRFQRTKALAVARGGGGGQDLIGGSPEVINTLHRYGMPFYVAFGHANGIVLIDKFADQAFHTPSGFGAALAQAVEHVAEDRRRELRIMEGREAAERAEVARQALEASLGRPAWFHSRGISISWPVVVAVLVALCFYLVIRLDIWSIVGVGN